VEEKKGMLKVVNTGTKKGGRGAERGRIVTVTGGKKGRRRTKKNLE